MMNEEKTELMTRYGITSRMKEIYFYKQYRYDNFEDALRFAERDAERIDGNAVPAIATENPE
jgi:hypothetical protein